MVRMEHDDGNMAKICTCHKVNAKLRLQFPSLRIAFARSFGSPFLALSLSSSVASTEFHFVFKIHADYSNKNYFMVKMYLRVDHWIKCEQNKKSAVYVNESIAKEHRQILTPLLALQIALGNKNALGHNENLCTDYGNMEAR